MHLTILTFLDELNVIHIKLKYTVLWLFNAEFNYIKLNPMNKVVSGFNLTFHSVLILQELNPQRELDTSGDPTLYSAVKLTIRFSCLVHSTHKHTTILPGITNGTSLSLRDWRVLLPQTNNDSTSTFPNPFSSANP
jgi:hypothetical protein